MSLKINEKQHDWLSLFSLETLDTKDDLLEFNSFILRIGEELIKQNKMRRLEFLLNGILIFFPTFKFFVLFLSIPFGISNFLIISYHFRIMV